MTIMPGSPFVGQCAHCGSDIGVIDYASCPTCRIDVCLGCKDSCPGREEILSRFPLCDIAAYKTLLGERAAEGILK